mgnify:CR=1 FL=1
MAVSQEQWADFGQAVFEKLGVEVIPAVELSVVWQDYQDLHLLGYGFDHENRALLKALAEFREVCGGGNGEQERSGDRRERAGQHQRNDNRHERGGHQNAPGRSRVEIEASAARPSGTRARLRVWIPQMAPARPPTAVVVR